ncbi:MAG: phage shock protein A [Alphaproteobacteria bacterium]|jgi:phage shock protein A
MSESLFGRVRRLVSGTVYDGIEAVEAAVPETTMREAIREIERTIEDVRDEVRKATGERHIAGRRIQFSRDKIEGLVEKINAGLAAGREDLAEAAVERQLDLEAQIPVLEKTQTDAADKTAELNGYVAALVGRRAEMEAELEAFRLARAQNANDLSAVNVHDASALHEKRADKAQEAFDRVMKNSTGVASVGRSDLETIAKLVELEGIERRNKVSERLADHRRQYAGLVDQVG